MGANFSLPYSTIVRPVMQSSHIGQSLADACNQWLSLADDEQLIMHKDAIDKRIKQVLTAEHFAAYKLHLVYRGEKLNSEQHQIVHDYLAERNADFIATLIAYEGESLPFPPAYFKESARQVKPVIWWKGLRVFKVPDDFVNIAVKLLSAPSSSASIERVFSNFGVIHTKLRNRLGNETASKLGFCYRMLRGQNEIDY